MGKAAKEIMSLEEIITVKQTIIDPHADAFAVALNLHRISQPFPLPAWMIEAKLMSQDCPVHRIACSKVMGA